MTENKTFADCLSILWHKVTMLKSHSILNDEGLKHISEKYNMNLNSNAPKIVLLKIKMSQCFPLLSLH